MLEGDSDQHRDAAIVGYHEGADRCIRDRTWSYIARPGEEPDELYHLLDDSRERTSLIDQHPGEATRLAARFGSYFRQARATGVVKGIQGKYEVASGSVG